MKTTLRLAAAAAFSISAGAAAADELTLYCSPQIEWCDLMVEAFTRETGISVAMTRKSSGETFAQIKAESANPRGDVWWGGTGDPHLQAAGEGLTEEYRSPMLGELQPWAQKQAEQSGYRTVGIYVGALGFGYNSEQIAMLGIDPPACWADLLNPALKSEVEVANPNSSGTSYTMLATMVQLMGEEPAFDYGLTMSGLKRADVRARAEGALETVGLTGLGARMPAALSGGQQQRVAVARAVVLEPDVLLFDEPLSNLDAKLRRRVRDEIRDLQQRLGLTAVYVTHDQEEALAISDRVIVMNAGAIAQAGAPRDLYERPASRFVADFIGDANLLEARILSIEGGVATVTLGSLRLSPPARGLAPGPVGLAIRPHAVRLGAPGEPGLLPATVARVVYLGARVEVAFETEAGPLFGVLDSLGAPPPAGAVVGLRIDERAVALVG